MFVQEFVRIDRPLPHAVSAFERTVLPRFGDLVRDAWEDEGLVAAAGSVPIAIGDPRDRLDGVAYAVSWPSFFAGFPAFDADIELAAVSPHATHLEFAGQSRFPLVEPWSDEDRRVNRLSMAAVDRLVHRIAALIEASVQTVT